MEWVLIIITVVALVVMLSRQLFRPKPRSKLTDEELKAMPDEEWESLARPDYRSENTSVLKVLYNQYNDLERRIETGHKETLELLDDQGRRRCLSSKKFVEEELIKRRIQV